LTTQCHAAAGAPSTKSQVAITIRFKGKSYTINGGYYSREGGAASLFHVRRDALHLAAHELGGKRAKNSSGGTGIAPAAGKEFLSKLWPFQKSRLTEWEDTAQAMEALRHDIEFRMVEIYEQLLKWPQSPLAPLQGDM
jgi:hypothetical protein